MKCVYAVCLLLAFVQSHVLPEEDDSNETEIDEYRLVYDERRDQFVRRKQRMEDVEEDYKQAKAAYRAAVNVELDQHVHHGHGNSVHDESSVHEYVHQHGDYSHAHTIPYLPDFEDCSVWNGWRQPCVDSGSYTTIAVVVIVIAVVVCCVCLPCLYMLQHVWLRRRRRRTFKPPPTMRAIHTTEDYHDLDKTDAYQNIFKL